MSAVPVWVSISSLSDARVPVVGMLAWRVCELFRLCWLQSTCECL